MTDVLYCIVRDDVIQASTYVTYYIHTRTHTHTHTHVRTYVHTHTYTCTTHTHVHVHTHEPTCSAWIMLSTHTLCVSLYTCRIRDTFSPSTEGKCTSQYVIVTCMCHKILSTVSPAYSYVTLKICHEYALEQHRKRTENGSYHTYTVFL